MTDTTRRRLLQGASAVPALALAGCTVLLGDDDEEIDESYSLPEASTNVEVEMGGGGENLFDAEIVHVEVGGTVTWTNAVGNHSATAYHPDNDQPSRMPEGAKPWDSGVLTEKDETFSHTFETEGVYDYYCTPHEPLGMVGTVVVGNPDPENQPGLSAPGEDFPGKAADKIESLNEKVRSSL